MADLVAITDIEHGGERDATTRRQTKAPKVIKAGEKVNKGDFSKEEFEGLEEAGAVGDVSLLLTNAQSTAATLQAEEYPEAERTSQLVNAPPASEDQIAEAHAIRTDQVSRAAGEDPIKNLEKAQEAKKKTEEKAAAEGTRMGTREPTIKE